MKRKDFVLIARCIKQQVEAGPGVQASHEMYELSKSLADALANDNRNFDPDRFLSACGTQ